MGKKIDRFKSIIGLSLSLSKARFKVRNEGTWLGIFWYLLAPILTFFLLLGIFQDRLGNNIPNYPLYLLLGIIMFNYFQNATSDAVSVLRLNGGIIKSFSIPLESLVGNVILIALFSHIFEIIILILFLLFFKISIVYLIFYPLILFILSVFILGFSMILSSLEVYFFDLQNIWGFLVKLIWFVTPIFYSVGGQNKLGILNLFNPMYYFITIAREIVIYNKIPELWIIFAALIYTLLFLIVGVIIFSKLKNRVAELV